jgi:hypothetical protein
MTIVDENKRLVVSKKVEGVDALLYSKGVDYGIEPSDVDFEPMLARDISERDQDFILKGKVVDKSFIATDVVYHGEFMANKPWHERYLELKKGFSYTPSIRMSGSIVVEDGDEIADAARAFSVSPHFEGVYVEGYDSDLYEDRVFISPDEVEVLE